jgi:mRNA interferase MazF
MTRYEKWEVVLVPFPFTDLTRTKKRPAVVLSSSEYNASGDVVIGFLTSNITGPERLGDYQLTSTKNAGLPLPSRFRLKLATIDNAIIVKKLGSLVEADRNGISAKIRESIA